MNYYSKHDSFQEPNTEAETSWQYFNWKLEYDADKAQECTVIESFT